MTVTERNNLLASWIKPSSDDEQDRQERALHMVTVAINGWNKFNDSDISVYAKGSYRNRTNVRMDSDVDIVVELKDCIYYDYFRDVNEAEAIKDTPYQGEWTPTKWRQEVTDCLVDAFGSESVDSSGKIALNVAEVKGSRPSIDVVPSFDYIRYDDARRTPSLANNGSCVFPKNGGLKTVNWPQQQYDNGIQKNNLTSKRYKRFVRALKNAENILVKEGIIDVLPSYFMECLIYNVDNSEFASFRDDLQGAFYNVLVDLHTRLLNEQDEPMVEPNELKYLFRGSQKWSVNEGAALVERVLEYLDYND
jgi:predicted nucleotidyltransferase